MGLLDIVGSFAGAGANILSRQNKEAEDLETRKQLADHQAKLEAQKLDTIERLKEERLRKQEAELIAADDKATTRAKELGTARRMEDFKAKLGQTDATEAELQEAFKQYDNKAVQAGDKVDTQFMDKRRADAAGDYVKAARETGNTGLLSQAKQSMDFAVKQDDADAKTAREERKADLAESNSQRRWEIEQAKIDARYFGDKKDATNKDFIGYIRESRMAINNEKDRLVSLMKAETDAEINPDKKAEIVRGYKERMAKLDTKADELDGDLKAFKAKAFDGGGSRSEPAKTDAEKRGMPASGGSKYSGIGEDGKPRYASSGGYTPDVRPSDLNNQTKTDLRPTAAEKDKAAIYQQAIQEAEARVQATKPGTPERARAESDVRAIQTEMQRANVSPKPSGSKPSGGQSASGWIVREKVK